VDLIAAKFDLHAAKMDDELLRSAKKRLESFLKTARTPNTGAKLGAGWLAFTTCRAIKPQPEKSTWMN